VEFLVKARTIHIPHLVYCAAEVACQYSFVIYTALNKELVVACSVSEAHLST
jgi:hypothetical protein